MKDSARPIAFVSIGILGAALAGVVYMGTRPGPRSKGTAPTTAATGSTKADPGAPASGGGSATGSGTQPSPPATASGPVVPATPTVAPTGFVPSANLTGEEQLMLEYLNRLRTDPKAALPHWRKRHEYLVKLKGCTDDVANLDEINSYQPRQPLAPNQALTDAARKHSQDMLLRNFFAHVNPDGVGPNQRVVAAGYPLPIGQAIDIGSSDGAFATYGAEKDAGNIESISLSATSDPNAVWEAKAYVDAIDNLVIDACIPSRGHRVHILGKERIRAIEYEVGMGAHAGKMPSGGGNKLHVSIEIALRNNDLRFVTGVVYADKNNNKQYDLGEGVPDVEVTLGAVNTKSAPGGGYALPVLKGTKGEVTAMSAKIPVDVADQNVKVDFTVQ